MPSTIKHKLFFITSFITVQFTSAIFAPQATLELYAGSSAALKATITAAILLAAIIVSYFLIEKITNAGKPKNQRLYCSHSLAHQF